MAANTASETTKAVTSPVQPETPGPTALQLSIAVIVLGSSAGLTLYTKRTAGMLRAMKTMEETQLKKHPPKVGPPTKKEWDKLRQRFEKDDLF
jgi:hypothetical protein